MALSCLCPQSAQFRLVQETKQALCKKKDTAGFVFVVFVFQSVSVHYLSGFSVTIAYTINHGLQGI